MTRSENILLAELASLESCQHRIDRVAEDLVSGQRRYAEIDAQRLGVHLGIEFGKFDKWGIGRGWALRKNIPGIDFSPDAKREYKISERLYHYSLYEAQAEDCLFMADGGIEAFIGWCALVSMRHNLSSSEGFHFSFRQITDGTYFEVISPYIDGIAVNEEELFGLRFVTFSEAIGDTLGTDSPYYEEDACDVDELCELREQKLWANFEQFKIDNPCWMPTDVKQCTCGEGMHCTCGARLALVYSDGCCH